MWVLVAAALAAEGTIVGPAGAPIAGATVTCIGTSGASETTQTAANGRFSLQCEGYFIVECEGFLGTRALPDQAARVHLRRPPAPPEPKTVPPCTIGTVLTKDFLDDIPAGRSAHEPPINLAEHMPVYTSISPNGMLDGVHDPRRELIVQWTSGGIDDSEVTAALADTSRCRSPDGRPGETQVRIYYRDGESVRVEVVDDSLPGALKGCLAVTLAVPLASPASGHVLVSVPLLP